MSKKTKKHARWRLRMAGGFVLSLLAMPILGIAHACIWLAGGIWNGMESAWRCFDDCWHSNFDPCYIPNIGYAAGMARQARSGEAHAAVKRKDWTTAAENWKKNRRLYDIDGWYRLGECYEKGRGVAQNLSLAYEHYLFAAQHGNDEADAACDRLEQFALSKEEHDRFLRKIWK